MRELIFIFIALLALSACETPTTSRQELSDQVKSIKEELSDQSRYLHENTDSLRSLAEKVEDEGLSELLYDIASDIENDYDDYRVEGLLDDLDMSFYR
jgi:hypothetical protein